MYYNHNNVENARKLRNEMTPWERKLWYCYLNKYPVRFSRQKPIDAYIVDFYCAKAGLIIELDGSGHFEPEQIQKDAIRTRNLEKLGLKIIRISNKDIDQQFRAVCDFIDLNVNRRIFDK